MIEGPMEDLRVIDMIVSDILDDERNYKKKEDKK